MKININKIRQFLFRTNSILGDINAIMKGKYAERLVRKELHKRGGSWINKLFK